MTNNPFVFQIFALSTKPITIETLSVSLPASEGMITALPGHSPLVTTLEMGIVSVERTTKEKLFFAVMGGIAQITPERVVIYTNAYEEGSKVPEDETGFTQWSKEITYTHKKEEDKIRFYLINTIKRWQKTHQKGNNF